MGMMTGKKGVVFGVANDYSLAWFIARRLHQEGAEIAFSHLPGEKMARRVRMVVEPIGARIIHPCDVTKDANIESFIARVRTAYDKIDFIVHAIAYANRDALVNRFCQTGREDFRQAMDISVYSLNAICQKALHAFNEGASVVTHRRDICVGA